MNQSSSEVGGKRTRTILVALGVGAVLAGVVVVFQYQPSPESGPSPDPISDACWDLLDSQQRLGRLAVRGMETYGRIDPALFDFSADTQAVRVSPDAKPLETSDDGAPLLRFQDALKAVNAMPKDVERLRAGHERAVKACGEQCPANVYPVDLAVVTNEKNPDAEFYKWQVKKEVPTNAEWQLGFLNLYGGAPTLSCEPYSVLELISKKVDTLAATKEDPAAEKAAGGDSPANEKFSNQPEGKRKKDYGSRDYAAGAAALGTNCTSTRKTTCQTCWLGPVTPGGYYFNGVKWCCGSC